MSELVSAGDVPIATEGLDPERIAAILAARARSIGRPPVAEAPGEAVIAVAIGDERFALPISAVAEILAATPPTPVPGAPAPLLGLIVSRGTLYNLFDPAPALGLTGGEAVGESGAHMLLLRGGAPRIALRIGAALGSMTVHTGDGDSGDGLTRPAVAADGGRIGLIAVPRLIAALGSGTRLGASGDE